MIRKQNKTKLEMTNRKCEEARHFEERANSPHALLNIVNVTWGKTHWHCIVNLYKKKFNESIFVCSTGKINTKELWE